MHRRVPPPNGDGATQNSDDDKWGKPRPSLATHLLHTDALIVAAILLLSFGSGMIFLVLLGAGVSDAPLPLIAIPCEEAESQSPRDLSTNATGLRPARAIILTDAQAHKLPLTNVHFHLGAEHRSDHYNNGEDSALYDRGFGQSAPVAPGLGLVRAAPHAVRPGWMCPSGSPLYTREQLMDTYEWQCCQGEMHVGKSYEVHYVHSSAAPGTDLDPHISDGLVQAAQGRGQRNPMVVVEAMVYHIVNDKADQYTFDDLVHGWDLPGKGNGSRVMYPGSTTGNSFNNTVCSPFQVTWHVDKACHPVSAASFDKMCCTMREFYGQQADLAPHAGRLLLDTKWVVPADEVKPLA